MLPSSAQSLKAAAVVVLFLGTAACTHGDTAPVASLEGSVPPPTREAMTLAPAPTPSLARLPSQTVASVKSRTYVNGVRQDILFRPGAIRTIANGMTVVSRTSQQETLDESVPLFKPTEAGIRSEIGTQFPRVAMQVADRSSSNAYGPYGMALGRAPGDVRCLYAWQYIDANRLPAGMSVSGPMSVRVRLCEAGKTFDAMAADMDHLQIGPDVRPDGAETSGDNPRIIVASEVVTDTPKRSPKAHVHRVRKHDRQVASRTRELAPVDVARGPDGGAEPSPPTPKFGGDLPAQAFLGPRAPVQPGGGAPAASTYGEATR